MRKRSGWSFSYRTLNTIGTRGGKKNYENGDYDNDDDDDYDNDDYDDDDNDFNVFFTPRDLKQGWQQGEPIKDDDDDEIDDNDTDYDDNDDDDDDNNNYVNGVFYSSERFFVGI